MWNRTLAPTKRPCPDLMEDFVEFVRIEMERCDVIARHYDYDSYTPLEYIATIEDPTRKKKYLAGYLRFISLTKEQRLKFSKEKNINLIPKSKEKFVVHPEMQSCEVKNRPRPVTSPPVMGAAVCCSYNKSAL